jgi:hypothetical protein
VPRAGEPRRPSPDVCRRGGESGERRVRAGAADRRAAGQEVIARRDEVVEGEHGGELAPCRRGIRHRHALDDEHADARRLEHVPDRAPDTRSREAGQHRHMEARIQLEAHRERHTAEEGGRAVAEKLTLRHAGGEGGDAIPRRRLRDRQARAAVWSGKPTGAEARRGDAQATRFRDRERVASSQFGGQIGRPAHPLSVCARRIRGANPSTGASTAPLGGRSPR